jgi:hypothetical protein
MANNLSGHITKSSKSACSPKYGLLLNNLKQLDIFTFIQNGTCFAFCYTKPQNQLSHKQGIKGNS